MNIIAKSALWFFGIAVVIIGLWIFAMIGMSFSTDVTDNAKYWGGFKGEITYKTQQKLFLLEVINPYDDEVWKVLSPPGNFKKYYSHSLGKLRNYGRLYKAPDDFESNNVPGKDEDVSNKNLNARLYYLETHVVDAIDKEVLIKISGISRVTSYSLWGGKIVTIKVWGNILTGKYTGENVDLRDLANAIKDKKTGAKLYYPIDQLISEANNKKGR